MLIKIVKITYLVAPSRGTSPRPCWPRSCGAVWRWPPEPATPLHCPSWLCVNPLGHEVRELSELRAFDEAVWDGGRLLDRWGAARDARDASWLDGCCFARLLHTSLPTCAFLEPLGFAGLRSSWQSLHLNTHCFFSSSSPTGTSRTSKCWWKGETCLSVFGTAPMGAAVAQTNTFACPLHSAGLKLA